jgi:hypothetical protein
MASIIEVPSDSRLWYDDRDIPFLQEDEKDDADIQQVQAATIRTLVDSGLHVGVGGRCGDERRHDHA